MASHACSFAAHLCYSRQVLWYNLCVWFDVWRVSFAFLVLSWRLAELLRKVLLGLVLPINKRLKIVLYKLVLHLAGLLRIMGRPCDICAMPLRSVGLETVQPQAGTSRVRLPQLTSADNTSMFSCATYLHIDESICQQVSHIGGLGTKRGSSSNAHSI